MTDNVRFAIKKNFTKKKIYEKCLQKKILSLAKKILFVLKNFTI
jgi:hypothetical protein